MFDPASHNQLKAEISERITEDRALLDQLREEIRPLRSAVRRIQPRSTTSISLVGTDGGNNKLQFDPFLVQIVRVVDSSANEYCLEAITPSTNITALGRRQFDGNGTPTTALGQVMAALGVDHLSRLSHMIVESKPGEPSSPTWVQVYREIVEWAILFSIIKNKDFGTDTLIITDGLLRSKVFRGENFRHLHEKIAEAIQEQYRRTKRRVYLAGVAKHSKVLARYRLAMAIEGILTTDYPAYVEIPRDIEEKAYVWSEYARGADREQEGGEASKYVAGKMFFVKFGNRPRDPVWPVDVFLPQLGDAQLIIGSMLADAINGFPVPLYPQCLQKAHQNAALVDFDFDILQDQIFRGIRNILEDDAAVLDVFRLMDSDPSKRRYS